MSSHFVSEQKILEEALPAQLVSALQNPFPSFDVLSESCRQLAQLLERLRPFVPPSVYDRVRLLCGDRIDGPAIIEEASSTAILHAGDVMTVGKYGELIIMVGQ